MQQPKERLVLCGAGEHAQVVAEAVRLGNLFDLAGYVDDNPQLHNRLVGGLPVLGLFSLLPGLRAQGIRRAHLAYYAVGGGLQRAKLYAQLLEWGFLMPSVLHPTAIVSARAHLADACYVGAGAVLNPGVHVAENCILNTRCLLEHDAHIGPNAHIGPGALVGSKARVGPEALVGMGAVVLPGVRIGKYARVGAGAVVTKDVKDGLTVVGNPAKPLRLKDE